MSAALDDVGEEVADQAVPIDAQARYALSEGMRLARAEYQLTPVTLTRDSEGDKRGHFHEKWRQESAWSSDPDQVKAWWVDYPGTSFALRTGPTGRADIIDLDVKGDRDAVTWWAEQGHPLTSMIVETLSGGLHLFAPACGLPTVAGQFAPGVDTRGAGGLVYAPGAYIAGEVGSYRIRGDLVAVADLAPLPGDLVAAIRAATPAKADRPADGRITIKDYDVAVRLTQAAVDKVAALPLHTDGDLFRDAQMGAAMMLGRLVEAGACSLEFAQEKLEKATLTVWPAGLSAKDHRNIDSGLADGPSKERWRFRPEQDAPVAEDEQGDYELAAAQAADKVAVRKLAVELGSYDLAKAMLAERARRVARRAEDEAERPRLSQPFADYGTWDDQLESVPLPEMAVPKLIPERGVGWCGGPSGTYKTFVATGIAIALAHGRPALEHPEFAVKRARKVLYIAAEGSAGVALRTRAARRRAGITQGRQLMVYRRAVDLTSAFDFAELVAFVLEHGFEFLIVDTFRQTTVGVNESDNTEVGAVLARFIGLRDEHGIGSMLIDHTNKSAQGLADLGGAGAKRANADYVLMIDLPGLDRGRDQQRTLRSAKLKDKVDGETWPIKLEAVPDIRDADGDPSAVVVVGKVTGSVAIRELNDWRSLDQPALPSDVVEYAGPGFKSYRDLARFMRARANAGGAMSLVDATSALTKLRSPEGAPMHQRDTIKRAWQALHEAGRLDLFEPDAKPNADSVWIARQDDLQ